MLIDAIYLLSNLMSNNMHSLHRYYVTVVKYQEGRKGALLHSDPQAGSAYHGSTEEPLSPLVLSTDRFLRCLCRSS